MKKYSRREFLKGLGVTSLGLPLLGIEPKLDMLQSVDDPLKAYEYRGWEELYRQMWGWDKVVRTTHSTNCTGSCGWNVQIKNGIAVRSEQSADFPDPEYNPRGCQKGASYERYVYGPQRVKYPLKRVGERGEGKWERISWDEAYDMIADKFLDIAEKDGTDHVFLFSPIPAMSWLSAGSGYRFGSLTGSVVGSFYDWYCDLPPGEPMTWGYMTETCESWDWANSRYIILWGANAVESRIPDAHFLTEARYKGAKIVVISPDHNPTCIKADQFVPIEDGTDAALGLAMAQVIVSQKLYDAAYIKVQTDLPFLVFKDTGKFVRQRDIDPAGSEEIFYRWDVTDGVAKAVGKHSLALNGENPALEGEYQIQLANGKQAAVTTIFELLKKKLNSDHRPEQAEKICHVSAQIITQLAREFATAKPAMIIEGAGTNHWYHNDLINRAQMLLPILTGGVGKNGGGFNHYVGQEGLKVNTMSKWFWPEKPRWQNTTLWTHYHTTGKKTRGIEKGWMPLYPQKGDSNKMMIIWRGNFLNQAKGQEAILKEIWPKQELIVDFNYRMDTTALYSDLVLPAASYFEKFDLNTTDMHEYVHSFNEAIKPLWESKPDFEIWRGLAQRISVKAKSRGMTQLATLYDRWVSQGDTAEKVAQWAFDNDPLTKGYTVEQVKKQPLRLKRHAGVTNESRLGEGEFKANRMAYTPFKEHTDHHEPWPTLTGRQQIYFDHEVFLEEKEQLPTYKSPVSGKYPLRYLSPHGRWSIHSTWRDLDWMLQLQRGGPIIELNPVDAKERGIADNDWVVMFNEHGESRLRAKLTYRLRPGTVMVYHGWERYTFGEGSGNWQAVTTVRVKPTQEVNYGHLKFKLNYWGPTGNNRDTLLDVKKA